MTKNVSNDRLKEADEIKKEKPKLTREQRKEIEKDRLLGKLHSNELKDIRTKVAYILNHYPESRNSDITLAIRYWEVFEADVLKGNLTQKKLYQLERMPSLTRARAKVQNEYGLYRAEDGVRKRRATLEEETKEAQLADKPSVPVAEIFADESGKTQKYFGVGGVWFNDAKRVYDLSKFLSIWKANNFAGREFHFSKLQRNDLDKAKEFFKYAMSLSDTWGFKAVLVERAKTSRSIEELTASMYSFLAIRGLHHEINTKRLSLPRYLNIWKDKEDGTDPILLEEIRNEVRGVLKSNFKDDTAKLSGVEPIDSKISPLIQLSDIFLGSVLRILNREGANRNHKDDLAEFVCKSLGLDINNVLGNIDSDAVHITLL